jgi:hypothetical protein
MKGPQENFSNDYCTLTQIKVYGQGLHLVMRNSLMSLSKQEERTYYRSTENYQMPETTPVQSPLLF